MVCENKCIKFVAETEKREEDTGMNPKRQQKKKKEKTGLHQITWAGW
jgi:hypothetical protein